MPMPESAGSWESHHAISSLIYRYTEIIDSADFQALGELFARGQIRSSAVPDPNNGIRGADSIRNFYAKTNKVYADGTLRTKHLCCNVRIDIDENAHRASARSAYVVLQATDELALQPIITGRYEDAFARANNKWHFTDRLIHIDQIGNLEYHLNFSL